MKKVITVALALFVAAGTMISCSPKSKKGEWIPEEKTKAMEACKKGASEEPNPGIDEAMWQKMIDKMCTCGIDKAEDSYDDYKAADGDMAGMEKIYGDCAEQAADEILKEAGL
ncbi:MAG: hypothetical protein ACOZCO_03995 [Bacteroidota bacterium]